MRRPHVYVATDGELHAMLGPLEFEWIPEAVSIVAPR
jgi:hypothetical protein